MILKFSTGLLHFCENFLKNILIILREGYIIWVNGGLRRWYVRRRKSYKTTHVFRKNSVLDTKNL